VNPYLLWSPVVYAESDIHGVYGAKTVQMNLSVSERIFDAFSISDIPFFPNMSVASMDTPCEDRIACIRFLSIVVSSPIDFRYLVMDLSSSYFREGRYASGSSPSRSISASLYESSLLVLLCGVEYEG